MEQDGQAPESTVQVCVVDVDAGLVLVKHHGSVKGLPAIAVHHESSFVGTGSNSELDGDVIEDPSKEAPDVAGAHTKMVLP